MTVYLSARDILVINARVLDATSGVKGVRDTELLASIVGKPTTSLGGTEMYSTVHDKAAVYLESIANYHVFVDGNKRTALVATARFLYLNHYRLTAPNKAAEEFMLSIATSEQSIEEISRWLEQNSERISL